MALILPGASEQTAPRIRRISPDAASRCIRQIYERPGKQSCFLTSTLNGLVVRQTIRTEEASHAQSILATDRHFTDHWVKKGDAEVWIHSARHTARALGSVIGQKVELDPTPPNKLEQALDDGKAVVLSTDKHSCLAYQHSDAQATVFDPYYDSRSGTYELAEISKFHQNNHRLLVI